MEKRNKMRRKINNKKGFTLIELIVVLAIIAILAAIIVPTTFGAIDNAKTAADNANLDALNSAVRMQKILDQANNPVVWSSVSLALSNASLTVPDATLADADKGYIWDDSAKAFIIGDSDDDEIDDGTVGS